MTGIAPVLCGLSDDTLWHQTFINDVAPFDLNKSCLLSGRSLVPDEHLPVRLYRYRPCAKYLDSEIGDSIFAANPQVLNDPYDVYANISLPSLLDWLAKAHELADSKSLLKRVRSGNIFQSSPILNRFFENLQGMVHQNLSMEDMSLRFMGDFKSEMRYISLTEVYDSLAMWAYYGGNHAGYCLEYEIDASGGIKRSDEVVLLPVVYVDTPFPSTDYLEHTILLPPDAVALDNIAFTFMVILCLQKMREWSHEREWRVILHTRGRYVTTPGKDSTGTLVPLNDTSLKVSAVHLGLKVQEAVRANIEKRIAGKGIKLYRMGIHKETLRLVSTRDFPSNSLY